MGWLVSLVLLLRYLLPASREAITDSVAVAYFDVTPAMCGFFYCSGSAAAPDTLRTAAVTCTSGLFGVDVKLLVLLK